MKRAVLLGANGQLGHDLQKAFSLHKDFKITPLTHSDVDVSEYQSLQKKLGRVKFDVLINTAAYHKVDEIEVNPKMAFLVNVKGAKNVAQFCAKKGAKVVFLSSDYVFGADERRKTPYAEDDLPGPVNTYGITKLAGEYMTQSFGRNSLVIRTTGLFGYVGSSGKGGNFVETMIRLGREKGAVSVVADQRISPTYTLNLANQIVALIKNDATGVVHAVSEGSCSWWEFATEIFKQTGQKVRVGKITSSQSGAVAPRPKYSVLSNTKLKKMKINVMKPWKENLKLYLLEKGYLTTS